jgi:RNA polymerase sigma factor (sigma-70 family)
MPSGSTSRDAGNARPTGGAFATTRWTVVLGASGSDTTHARAALEELCRVYWRPIYTYVRRQGHAAHDAQDLTQEFFGRLLAAGSLGKVDASRGRFRSFLLASLKHFLANEWDKLRALKRGGGVRIVPLDADTAVGEQACGARSEGVAGVEASGPSPELAYDRQWALALLARVVERLREEHARAGKGAWFEQLRETLTAERGGLPYVEIGARLGLSEGAVKVAVHRLRQRYREVLRAEIAETLENPALVEEELRDLFAALSG